MKLHLIFLRVLACIFIALSGDQSIADEITLVDNGQPVAGIVLDANAIPAEKTAAAELQKYIKEITGANLPIEERSGEGTNIFIGRSAAVDEILPNVNWTTLGTEGVVIVTTDGNLILAGPRPRGTIYAVYTFLQDTLECRWYADDAEVVPRKKTLRIPPLTRIETPAFEYRQIPTRAVTPLLAAKLRLNGGGPPESHGGSIAMGGEGGHTLLKLIDPEKYFEKHPEWFAYRKDQKKRVPRQLCMTNKEVQQAVAREIMGDLDTRYSTWRYSPKIVTVSSADNPDSCQCPTCLASFKREGSQTGPLLELVNHVAGRVATKYPDVLINTLAFWRTEEPPKNLRLHKNVLIQLAVLDRNHKLPISEVPQYNLYVRQWSSMTPHLYMWDYMTNFRNFIQPHPNYFVIGESLRFYHHHGVTGVYIQGAYGSAGEFMRMRAWVTAQLLWNPNQDDRTLMKDFLDGYYGPAGRYLMNTIDLMNRSINRQKGLWLNAYGVNSTKTWLRLKDLNGATELFDEALKAVKGDKTLTYRVRRAKLSIDIVWLQRYHELKREADQTRQPFLGPEDPYAELKRIEKNEFGVNAYREWRGFDEYVETILRKNFPKQRKAAVPTECGQISPGDWIDIQQDRLTVSPKQDGEIVDDPSASDGKALLLTGDTRNLQGSFDLPDYLTGRWRVYLVARAEPKRENIPAAIVMGIYARNLPDGSAGECSRVEADCPENLTETYRTFDLGDHHLEGGATIWVQPNGPGSFGEIKTTRIDRMFLIRVDTSAD